MTSHNDFWGIGVRGGIDLEFILFKGIGIFGRMAGAMLYSKFDVDQTEINANNSDYDYTITRKFYTDIVNCDIALGLCWNTLFCQDKYRFGLKVAYELHRWFDMNRLRRFFDDISVGANDETARGDLSLSGFSFRLALDF
jgi:hypothetical protein